MLTHTTDTATIGTQVKEKRWIDDQASKDKYNKCPEEARARLAEASNDVDNAKGLQILYCHRIVWYCFNDFR